MLIYFLFFCILILWTIVGIGVLLLSYLDVGKKTLNITQMSMRISMLVTLPMMLNMVVFFVFVVCIFANGELPLWGAMEELVGGIPGK